MKAKGIVFDLDGTLLDSSWVWNKIDEEFLGSRGLEVPGDYVEAISALGFRGSAEYTIKRFGFDDEPEELMKIWGHMAQEEYDNNVKIKPHVKEYLDFLKKEGVMMAVATASYEALFMPCLKNNGIYEYFHSFTTIAEVNKAKNSPDVYIRAAHKMGLKPEECLVFEDLPEGIMAAKRGGFRTVAVPDSFAGESADDMIRNADFVARGYKELIRDSFYG